MHLMDRIKEKAKANPKVIVFPEGEEKRVIKAAELATREKIVKELILLGDEDRIKEIARQEKIDLTGVRIINPKTSDKIEEYTNALYELRKHKGVTKEQARELVLNPLYYATMMVKLGDADGEVAGSVTTTSDVLRPPLQLIKGAKGVKTVSSFFLIIVSDCPYGTNGAFIFADSGLNPDPNPEELADIAITSAVSARVSADMDPKVAMMSFSTKGSADHPLVDKMKEATRLIKEKKPDLVVDGELQGDAALMSSVAARKAPGSPVAGKANVLIFPNLDAGNLCYKLVQCLAKAEAYGPIVQGLAKPVNDLSRGCSAEDIVGVIAITVCQAQASIYDT